MAFFFEPYPSQLASARSLVVVDHSNPLIAALGE